MLARGLRVARLVAGPDDHADLLDAGRERLLHENAEDGFLLPVAVDEGLQRQRALVLAGGGDDRLLDFQVGAPKRSLTEDEETGVRKKAGGFHRPPRFGGSVAKSEGKAEAEHRHEILQPAADFGAGSRGDDLFRERRDVVADFRAENQVLARSGT